MIKKFILILFLCILVAPANALAEEEPGEGEESKQEKAQEAAEEAEKEDIPEILDIYERNAELHRFEITPYTGYYLGDVSRGTYMFGLIADVRITPVLSFGVDFAWSQLKFDSTSSFGSIVTNKNEYILQGVFTFNMPAAFLSNKHVFETDLFTTIGGGIMRINNSNRGAGFLGGGMKTYFSSIPWLGFRVEVRNYFSTVPTAAGSKYSSDMTVTGGPTFMLPPKLF